MYYKENNEERGRSPSSSLFSIDPFTLVTNTKYTREELEYDDKKSHKQIELTTAFLLKPKNPPTCRLGYYI